MAGTAIQLAEPVPIETGDDKAERFRFNYDLPQLISSPERLANAKVVVISVAGAFRKGKSFLLNYFLMFLRARSRGSTRDWIRSADGLKDGFHWRSGSDRDTTGILIWSEPFFFQNQNGEEVAVLLMDTQGTFDHQTALQDCTTIFAFSTLLSSVQIFNVSQNIQETDLQYLRLFVEFAGLAKEKTNEKLLQHLWFLVRDWQYPDEYKFGVTGGERYLRKVLACDDGKPRENQDLRRGIRQHFERASCCLLPHPGKAVAWSKFCGTYDELDRDFAENLESFVTHILSPENLVVKKVNGKELTGRELFSLVEVYYSAFRSGTLPTPKSIFIATVEMANMTAAEDAKKFFEDGIGPLSDPTHAISDQELEDLLNVMLEQAMDQFDAKCMEAGANGTAATRMRLEEQLRGQFQQQHVLNRLKSDRIGAEEKNRMLAENIQRMQADSLAAASRMSQMEVEFAERVREISTQSISKEQMEQLLQAEMVKHSVAQKEQEKRNEDLMTRVEEMAKRNEQLTMEMRNGEMARREMEESMDNWKQQMAGKVVEHRNAANEGNSVLGQILPVIANVAATILTTAARNGRCCIS